MGFGNTRCIKVVLDNSGPAPAVELQAGVTVTGVGRIVLERLRLSQAGVDVLSFTTDQHIHRPVPAGQVDQHRAVVAPPAQRELIHTEHRHHADGGSGSPRINPNSVDRLRHTQRRGKP